MTADDVALHPAPAPWHVLELCAGAGGLGLGIKLAVPGAVGVAYVEREAAAAATLVTRMEAGDLAPAPVWSDLATFDARPWRGRIHCVASGDPCQPNSVAGKGLGAADERFLIDQVLRIVDECRPLRLFRENVTGNAAGQLAALVPPLERLGYRVEAGIFSSAATGNSHGRERLVLMADREDCPGWLYPRPWRPGEGAADARGRAGELDDAFGSTVRSQGSGSDAGAASPGSRKERQQWLRPDAGKSGADLGKGDELVDAERARWAAARSGSALDAGAELEPGSGDVAHASAARLQGREFHGAYRDERHRPDAHGSAAELCGARLPPAAPGPSDPRWAEYIDADPFCAPALGRFDFWTIARRNAGLPPLVDAIGRRGGLARDLDADATARLKSEVRRVADAMADRVERLRQLGNGVDPVVGWDAWVHLDARHRTRRERDAAEAAVA